MKNVTKLSERELTGNLKTSWHDQYKNSAWIFVGGLPYDLTEGDIICVFSQYGEIQQINLIRDKQTGKQKGFCFICYEDQRSTILAVDNLNGIKLCNRSIRVDHVEEYKVPKDHDDIDDETKRLRDEGVAPKYQLPPDRIKKEVERRKIKKERR
jgi:RNA-binding motif protein, X-linked 2